MEGALQTHGLNKYTSTLADVLLSDGTNINHELFKDGWCWCYRKCAPGNMVLHGWRRTREKREKACGVHRGNHANRQERAERKSRRSWKAQRIRYLRNSRGDVTQLALGKSHSREALYGP
jgi:endonuclease YncB( thermonuclease family)